MRPGVSSGDLGYPGVTSPTLSDCPSVEHFGPDFSQGAYAPAVSKNIRHRKIGPHNVVKNDLTKYLFHLRK